LDNSIDSQSWIQSWKEGRTAFHRNEYHEKLLQYFPRLNPQRGQKVFVPLCGKSKDMLWLHEQGLVIHGVELYEGAVKAFFEENKLKVPQVSKKAGFVSYSGENLYLRCGDFFELREKDTYDFVYDRAALVALPQTLRKKYAEQIGRCLKKGGKCLLIAYEYDPSQMEGPPFNISEKEITSLYGDLFSIQPLEKQKPLKEGTRLSAVESLLQTVYILEKRAK
jgi:thiopurine S-methyltransferase